MLGKILDQDPLFKWNISPWLLWSKNNKLTLAKTICAHILGRICYVTKGTCLIYFPFHSFPVGKRCCNHQKVSATKGTLWWVWMQEFDVELPFKSWDVYFQLSIILFKSSNLPKRTFLIQKPFNELVSIWCNLV